MTIVVDMITRTVTVGEGAPITLGPVAFAMVAYLAGPPRRRVTRDELWAQVWGSHGGGPAIVRYVVRHAREKGVPINNQHGQGYMLEGDTNVRRSARLTGCPGHPMCDGRMVYCA